MVPNGLDPGFDRAASRAQGFLKTARAKRSGRRPVHPTLIGQNPSNEVTRRFIALAPQFAGVTLGVIAQSVRSKTPHRREFLASCESSLSANSTILRFHFCYPAGIRKITIQIQSGSEVCSTPRLSPRLPAFQPRQFI